MKILFSGYHNPHFETITEYMEKAMTKLGHTCIPFDDRDFLLPGRLRQKVSFLHKWDLHRLNNKLLSLVFQNKPNLCLVSGGHRIFPETIQEIKKRGICTALWTTDSPFNFGPILKASPYYDYIFCGGTEAQDLLAKSGINKTHWLPFACDPEIHKAVEVNLEEKRKWGSDITFVGSFYPNRKHTFEAICDFDIKIWGPGWDKLSKNSPLSKSVINALLNPKDWKKIYSSSKIIIVVHYQDGQVPCYQASPKVYETLACKSFLLVDNQKDVKTLFEDGKHLVMFTNIKDLRDKIEYYLSHAEKRKQIALQGYKETTRNHTYVNRIERLIKIIYPDLG